MVAEIFCCRSVSPYRPRILDHETRFTDFILWERHISDAPEDTTASNPTALLGNSSAYAIQVVRQVNYGPVKWKRYFVSAGIEQGGSAYKEIVEQDLIEANYEKLNTFVFPIQEFQKRGAQSILRVNIYKKNPVNKHHWRANIARPAGDIDLNPGGSGPPATTQPLVVKPSEEIKNDLQANKKDEKDGEKGGGVKEDKINHEGINNNSEVPADSLLLERIESDGDYDAHNDRDYRSAYDHDSESERDYTACSADDCGYCGSVITEASSNWLRLT